MVSCWECVLSLIITPFVGRCSKKTRTFWVSVVFIGLAATHSLYVKDFWQYRSDRWIVPNLDEWGFSYNYITNIMAAIAAGVILSGCLSVIEVQFRPKTGYWMIGVMLSLHATQMAWLGFWNLSLKMSTPKQLKIIPMWELILGVTFGVSCLFLVGGRVWEFLKGLGVCFALTFAFLGAIALCRASIPRNWKWVVEGANGLSSIIPSVIFCLFFAGITAIVALLFAYLPCRCSCCFIRERGFVIIFGIASMIFACIAGGILVPGPPGYGMGYNASECNTSEVADWGRCSSGDFECCTSSGSLTKTQLLSLLTGIGFGSWMFAAIALVAIIRTATAMNERCLANVPDLYEVEVYEDGELLKTVLTRTKLTRDWESAVDKGVTV